MVAELARRLNCPVRIDYDRTHTFTATRMRSGSQPRIRSAFDQTGRLLARETEALNDIGAYVTGGHYLPGSMLQRHVQLYDVPAERYQGRAVHTNAPPTGAFRGQGSPQINAAGEIHLDIAARRMGFDPVEIRLRNAVAPHAIEPYTGLDIGKARLREGLSEGAAAFGWQTRRAPGGGKGRIRRGVGMAAAAHVNGCFPGSDEASTMTMALRADGRIETVAALHDLGCGSNTTLAQIAAEVLGIRPADLVIVKADTDLCGYDIVSDRQTSGGLLVAVGAECVDDIMRALRRAGYGAAAVIGRVSPALARYCSNRPLMCSQPFLAAGDACAGAGPSMIASSTRTASSRSKSVP